MNIAELLLDHRTDAVVVAVTAVVVRQILPAHYFRFMGAALVALMRNAIVRRKSGQHRGGGKARRRQRAVWARYLCLPFVDAAPVAEWSAACAFIVV